MSIVESIEYYSACSQCGAANTGKEKCEYCGASLVKSRINTNFVNERPGRSEEEEKNFMEDADLSEIKGKIIEKDEFLMIFCPLFGGIFLLVPTIILIVFSSAGIMEPWIYPMLSLFWLIGIGGIYPLINHFVKGAKCRKGEEISGIVRGYEETMVTVNGRPVLNVRILIDENTEPKILLLNTGNTRKKYPLGKVIKLKGYKNNFIIL